MTHFRRSLISVACALCGTFAAQNAGAQGMDHSKMPGMDKMPPEKMAMMEMMMAPPSQAAFATIQDIVKKLKADPKTDWSKVNLEALRQHLIDMDNVVMRAVVKQSNVDGGISMDITGSGEVGAAVKRMMTMHAQALTDEGVYVAKSSEIDGGVRLIVTAKNASDAKAVAMVRALGFAGLVTEGDHHAMHHMMVASGQPMMAGHVHKP